jgi:hypothetical protein
MIGPLELLTMPIPNLIHPVPIIVEKISRSTTFYDEDAREPVQFADRPVETKIDGQVKWFDENELAATKSGPAEGSSGYVLFRQIDLTAKSLELEQNDRFTKIGLRTTDVYVTALRPVGHYPDQAGHTMIKAYFADRQPSRVG